MDCLNQQNLERYINLLCSQRYFYSQAKKNRNLKLFFSSILVFIAPIVILLFDSSASIFGTIGGIGVVFSFIIDFIEKNHVRTAANIQEQFDTELFGIGWNRILCGIKIPIEIILNGGRKYKGEKTNLKNWYGNLEGINYPYNILVCQRSNLIWDWRLRRKFAFVLISLLVLIIGLGVTICIIKELKLANYLFGIFIPSIPAFVFIIREIYEHFTISKDKIELMQVIDSLIEKNVICNSELRQIQDRIYTLRLKQALVPDWFYEKYRTDYEMNLTDSNIHFIDKLTKHN